MIATSHVIIGGAVGAAVGTVTQNPALALAAGFISHLICDSIPHFDHPPAPRVGDELVWTKAVWIFAFADSIVAGLITLALWGYGFEFNWLSPFLWGAAGGYLPDFIDNVPFWKNLVRPLPVFRQFHKLHQWIHDNWQFKYPMPEYWILGAVTQLALVAPSLWYLLN